MSSHHIIREDQEPALIIANGASCNPELMGQLLEWSPTVVVVDGAAKRVKHLGIHVDYVIGDFDGFNEDFIADWPQAETQFVQQTRQDNQDLEKAIDFLIEKGHKAANIVWGAGLRADHALANLGILGMYVDKIKLVMYDDHSTIFAVKKSFEKWYAQGTKFSIMPLGKVTNIYTENLEYPLKGGNLELGVAHGNSNKVLSDGFVKLNFDSGLLLVMECVD
jgi:thiamine pyrophosphokinase